MWFSGEGEGRAQGNKVADLVKNEVSGKPVGGGKDFNCNSE